MKVNAPLSTREGRTSTYVHHFGRYSNATTMRHHHHHQRREKGYMPEEFKKAKPPSFYGEMSKTEDAKA